MDYKKYSPATSEYTQNYDLENTIPRNYKNDYNLYNKGNTLKRPIFNEPLKEKNEIPSYSKSYNQCKLLIRIKEKKKLLFSSIKKKCLL